MKFIQSMKFIEKIVIIFLIMTLTACQQKKKSLSDIVPEYKTLINASKKVQEKNGLKLFCYGVNNDIKKNYREIEGTDDFTVDYWSIHPKDTVISMQEARDVLTSTVQILLDEINTDEKIRELLTHYPITTDDLAVNINFADELKIDLGRGIAGVSLRRGKVKYEKFTITKYTDKYGASGVHYDFHEESYEETLRLANEGTRPAL